MGEDEKRLFVFLIFILVLLLFTPLLRWDIEDTAVLTPVVGS